MGFELFRRLLEREAESLSQLETSSMERWERELLRIQELLSRYGVQFPFFSKIDSWEALHKDSSEDYDVWVLERIGWGLWKGRFQLLYVLEGIPVPQFSDADIVSINAISQPFLKGADFTETDDETDQLQVFPLASLSASHKANIYPYVAYFLLELSELWGEMKRHEHEFSSFLKDKLTEVLQHSEEFEREELKEYLYQDRRVELFQEFLEKKSYPEAHM